MPQATGQSGHLCSHVDQQPRERRSHGRLHGQCGAQATDIPEHAAGQWHLGGIAGYISRSAQLWRHWISFCAARRHWWRLSAPATAHQNGIILFAGTAPLPDPELFIRWLQLATFLPAMQFSHLPDEYHSELVTRVARELKEVRQTVVIALLKKYLSPSMNEGLPLVRPLWMLDPHDPACLIVSDEFSVGEELIVAPILDAGREEREGKSIHAIHANRPSINRAHNSIIQSIKY